MKSNTERSEVDRKEPILSSDQVKMQKSERLTDLSSSSRPIKVGNQTIDPDPTSLKSQQINVVTGEEKLASHSADKPATVSQTTQQYDIQMNVFQALGERDGRSNNMSPNEALSSMNDTGRKRPTYVSTKEAINVTDGLNMNTSEKATIGTFKNKEDFADDKREENIEQAAPVEEQFFLTGVNVQNQDIHSYAIMEKQDVIEEPAASDQGGLEFFAQEEASAAQVDNYKMVAVVDSGRSFTNNECIYLNLGKSQICHLSANSHTSLQFDELISSYDQVFKIGKAMAHTFMTRRNTNKVVLNVSDQFATNNNAGFNLANFRPKFLQNYFTEVVQDYERSFIGSFAAALLHTYIPNSGDQYELFFTMAKFEGNMGYSLTQNYDEVEVEVDVNQQQQMSERHQTTLLADTENQTTGVNLNELNDTGDEILEAKPLEETQLELLRQVQKKNQQVHERRQEIMKKGSIPEFVPIKDSTEFYQIYTEANLKNKLLVQSQRQQQLEDLISGQNIDQNKDFDNENIDLKNIKDDVVIMQFKLVKRRTMKVLNTQTFVNLPTSKMSDINSSTLVEIIYKQNCQTGQQQVAKKPQKKEQFLPYNKSILTRILYPCLNKSNFLVINHFSKKTVVRHLNQQVSGHQAGPAKGLFNTLFKLGFETLNRLTKKKLSSNAALKILQTSFKTDLKGIFKEIDMFREGIKSFEVYTEQTANMLQKAGVQGASQSSTPLTMFHQIIHFLVLQEEMTADAETYSTNNQGGVNLTNPLRSNNFFPSLLPEEEIQKVIFDTDYLNYIQKKQMEQMRSDQMHSAHDIYNSGTGIVSSGQDLNLQGSPVADLYKSKDTMLSAQANTSVELAAMLANQSTMPHLRIKAAAEKEKKLQYVQYECVKSELKEEYDKRVGFLHKRLNKKAQIDPSFLLLNSMSSQPTSTRSKRLGPDTFFQGNERPGADRAKQFGQQIQFQKKILSGPKNRLSKSKVVNGANILLNDRRTQQYSEYDINEDKKSKQQKKDDYYKFYLDNAQKAINLMIDQHKTTQGNQKGAAVRSGSGDKAQSSHGNIKSQTEINRSTLDNIGISSAMGLAGNKSSQSRHLNPSKSNSLHERRFQQDMHRHQQRLEPLINRPHINRITIRQNDQFIEQNRLGDVQEFDLAAPPKAMIITQTSGEEVPSFNVNQVKSKPFSANMTNGRIVRVHENPQASTHYSSFHPKSVLTNQKRIGQTPQIMNGTVLSSKESHFKNVHQNEGSQEDPTGKSSEANFYTDINQHQNQIFNYSSDQNLHDRRPFTTENVAYGNQNNGIEGLKNERKFGREDQGHGLYQQPQIQGASKSLNKSKGPSNLLPPTLSRPNGLGQAPKPAQKRLLSNTSAKRGGVRGELLTNGYQSLRAQGMLRAVKVDSEGERKGYTFGQRNNSNDMEHVNICIQAYGDINSNSISKLQDSVSSKEKNNQIHPSPMKMNSRLVPKDLRPKKERLFQKLKNSRPFGISNVLEPVEGAIQIDQIEVEGNLHKNDRASLRSQEINATADLNGPKVNQSFTTTVNVHVAGNIGESSMTLDSFNQLNPLHQESAMRQSVNSEKQAKQ